MNLTGLSIRCGDSLLADNHYTYDGNGNRLEKQQLSGTTRYAYDALNQLVKAEYPTYGEEMFYDRAGNCTRRRTAGVEEVYAYDAGNHLLSHTKDGIKTVYEYDKAGNLLNDDRAAYSYDAFNRQMAVETFDGNIQINHYDAEGLRHEMEENGKLVQFILRGSEVVVEETQEENIRYIRTHELLASDAESARTYYHYASDEMGSITHVTDEEGNLLNRYEYDAWGNLTLEDEQVPNRFKYTGEQFDPITQQYYLRARFYNPALARFMQEDTYRGDGLNLYAYCANNPVRYVDPSGHEKTVSFADRFEGHVADQTVFSKEHGVFVYYDTPLANKVNEMIKQNQTQTPKVDMPNDGRRDERGSKGVGDSDELIHVYRGTDKYAEIVAYHETGQLMSDATRNLYFETGNLDVAYEQSGAIHDNWLRIWGNQNDYVQAHGAFGTELSQAFGLDRTFMSVTTDPDVARRFAGPNGQVFEAYIPKYQLIEQTLEGAGETEYLIKFGAGGFK